MEERLATDPHRRSASAASETADLVIEAVFENMALKKEIFRSSTPRQSRSAILATNTSTLDIDAIAAATSRPGEGRRPALLQPGERHAAARDRPRHGHVSGRRSRRRWRFAKRLGKVGVVVGNAPGFVGNRMMFPYMYEAQFLVEDGATPEQVDRALTDFGMAMGIFAVDDMAGLDVAWRVRQELGQFTEPGARKPLVADKLCEMGRFGQKTGSGWYRYGDDRKPIPDPEVLALIERWRPPPASGGGPSPARRSSSGRSTRSSTKARACSRKAWRSAPPTSTAIYVNGYGFPACRGGPMFYADRVGLAKIHDRVVAFHREHGQRWAPAPLLARLAHGGLELPRAGTPSRAKPSRGQGLT